eukprot:1641453-Amphidinium_carterae.1
MTDIDPICQTFTGKEARFLLLKRKQLCANIDMLESVRPQRAGVSAAMPARVSIFDPCYRRVLIAGLGILVFQQLNGANAIIFYT